jgi:hypothetical protein
MNARKKSFTAGLAVAAVVAGSSLFAFSHSAFAQSNGSDSLASKIAAKFNLSESEVQAVIDEERQARHIEHEKRLEDRLTQAVSDGKITSEQKDAIIAKLAEVKPRMDALKDETDDSARHDGMKAIHDELTQWAEDNDIPARYLMQAMRGGMGSHHNMRMMDGAHGDTDSSAN